MRRAELRCSLKYSLSDGYNDLLELLSYAADNNISAVTLMDTDVLGYETAYDIASRYNYKKGLKEIKVIYGVRIRICIDTLPYYVSLIACDEEGFKNLYYLYSKSAAGISFEDIDDNREGLMIGCPYEDGELAIAYEESKDKESYKKIAEKYDYIEMFASKEETVKKYNLFLEELSENIKSLITVVSDSRYLKKEDCFLRKISNMNGVISNPDREYHMKNTEELFEILDYLDNKKAEEFIINNCDTIAARAYDNEPFIEIKYQRKQAKTGTEILRDKCQNALKKIYPKRMSDEIAGRIEWELQRIERYNYEDIFLNTVAIKDKLKLSRKQYYAAGNTGSSLVSYLLGISSFNPLPLHYRCKNADYVEFVDAELDNPSKLEDKNCPICNNRLIKDGYNIEPYGLFGYDKIREPKIVLNISDSEYETAMNNMDEILPDYNIYSIKNIRYINSEVAQRLIIRLSQMYGLTLDNNSYKRYMDIIIGKAIKSETLEGRRLIIEKESLLSGISPYMSEDKKTNIAVFSNQLKKMGARQVNISKDVLLKRLKKLGENTLDNARMASLKDERIIKIFNDRNLSGIYDEKNSQIYDILKYVKVNNFNDIVRINSMLMGDRTWESNGKTIIAGRIAKFDDIITSVEEAFNIMREHGFDEYRAWSLTKLAANGSFYRNQDRYKKELQQMLANNISDWQVYYLSRVLYLCPRAQGLEYSRVIWEMAYYKSRYPSLFEEICME